MREVEQASFTPLVFATTGGMGKEAIVFYRCLASLLSHHNLTAYSRTLAWMRCTLSFSAALCYGVHPWKPVHLALSCGSLSGDGPPEWAQGLLSPIISFFFSCPAHANW